MLSQEVNNFDEINNLFMNSSLFLLPYTFYFLDVVDLAETYVESTTESMPEERIPEQRFLEDVDNDDTAIGEVLFEAYREQVYHSQREVLSVSQSSSSMSDRTGHLVVETSQRTKPRTGTD